MESSKRASAYVAALKIPVTVLSLFAIVLAAYYFFYVTLHQTYLVERNFRLLATLGEQIVATIQSDERVMKSLADNHSDRDSALVDWSDPQHVRIQRRAAGFLPFLRSAEVSMDWSAPNTFTLQFIEPESRLVWRRRDDAMTSAARTGIVQLELQAVLNPLLRVEAGKGIFDALLIAAPDGRVLFQAGDAKLRIAQLDRLTQRTDGKTPELAFQGLARAPSMVDVVVSGSQYKLFTQSCCGQMVPAASPNPATSGGWVLCGLVAQRTLSADSYAVSFSSLILLSAMLLVGLISWPFLKLVLLGESQRVKGYDVVLVAICTIVGIALMTIGALDYFAYSQRLQATLDDQLRLLAVDIDTQARNEIASASEELDRLQSAVGMLPLPRNPNLTRSQALFDDDVLSAYPFFDSFALIDGNGRQQEKLTLGSVGTLFIEVGDREYFQHWTSASRATEPFLEAIQSATTGEREAVLSKPSIDKRFRVAALSIPLHALIEPVVVPGFGFAVINDAGSVLFHSDPRHNLSEDFFVESDGNRRLRALVGARHAELVDLQYWGDDHRAYVFPMNVGQPWTLVTFYDKDLIRTVNVEWLILTLVLLVLYVGAYVVVCLGVLFVRPRYRAPWLWPDPGRSKAYVDLVPPVVLLVAAFALAIALLPVSELVVAAWLLPLLGWVIAYHTLNPSLGRARLTWPVVVGLATVAALMFLALQINDDRARLVLLTAFGVVPAWIAVASARRSRGRQSPLALPVHISYGLIAGLCLSFASMLPAAAFFRVGYGTEVESFIKYGQLQFALDRLEDRRRDDQVNAEQVEALVEERYENWGNGALAQRSRAAAQLQSARAQKLLAARANGAGWGVYQGFFFSTEPVGQTSCDLSARGATGANAVVQSSVLPEILEELLPFYSESSVQLRELVHDQAADERWNWRRNGSDLIFCLRGSVDPPFKSTVPRLLAGGPVEESAATGPIVLVVLLSLIVAAIAWLVRFALRTVFVIDVIEPIWSGIDGAIEQVWGPNLFLVSAHPVGERPHTSSSNYCQVDVAQAPDERTEQDRWFNEQFDRVEQSPSGQNVLILHFEHRLQDPASNERKLALLERVLSALNRTIVIVSTVPPGRFSATGGPVVSGNPVGAEQADWARRWAAVLAKFTVVPVTDAPAAPQPFPTAPVGDWMSAGWREALWRVNALGFAHAAKFLDDERRDPVVNRLWKDVLPYAWHPDRPALTINQLLVEVGERSENHYREIWESCTPAEKLVLGQIAGEGLVNQKTARTVRMLMARGLVRRQPNFVVMNETFRQFVLSASSRAEVTALEDQATSTWDAIRWPFLILLIGSLTFFFATQHELFNTALGILTGVTAAVPALVKMASLFGGRKEA